MTTHTPLASAGQNLGETPVYAREAGFEQRFFFVAAGSSGAGQIEYICRSYAGAKNNDDTTAAVWQVQRFSYNASNQLTTFAFAGDDDAFDQVCDNRVTLDYN